MEPEYGGGSSYAPLSEGMAAPLVNVSRGQRIGLIIFAVFILALAVFAVMTTINTASGLSRDTTLATLAARVAWITGAVQQQLTRPYTFLAVYDSVTLAPVTNPAEIFFGLNSGAAPAILKGRVELVFASDATREAGGGGAVRYNLTVAYGGNTSTVSGLEIVATAFNARSDHLIERTTVVMCGGLLATPCTPQGIKRDLYTGTGVLPPVLESVIKADEMHTALFLLVFINNGTREALKEHDARFVIKLEA